VRIARALTTSVYRSLRTWLSGIAKAGLASRVPSSAAIRRGHRQSPARSLSGRPGSVPTLTPCGAPRVPRRCAAKGRPRLRDGVSFNQSQAGARSGLGTKSRGMLLIVPGQPPPLQLWLRRPPKPKARSAVVGAGSVRGRARVWRPGSGERMGGAAAKGQSAQASRASNWLTLPACRSPLPRVPITDPSSLVASSRVGKAASSAFRGRKLV
jgi:hypothetical protein